jgi:beta-lactamase class A
MIIKSDNPCAEALLQKIGFREITDEAKKIGLKNTTFLEGDRPLTSAGDLAVFLATLESGQMLQPASRAKLLDAMKRNIFRQGIPAGANGQVADKVGFLDNFLHDAAVVYSPNGTYVLSVMSEDSSWAKIAELTRAIEKLRAS